MSAAFLDSVRDRERERERLVVVCSLLLGVAFGEKEDLGRASAGVGVGVGVIYDRSRPWIPHDPQILDSRLVVLARVWRSCCCCCLVVVVELGARRASG